MHTPKSRSEPDTKNPLTEFIEWDPKEGIGGRGCEKSQLCPRRAASQKN